MRGRIHDSELLDALEQLEPKPFTGSSFRIVPERRDPIQARLTGSGGRWDDGQFPVLYTSIDSGTAIAEVKYHLSRQPIFPSKVSLLLYELEVVTKRTLKFLDVEELTPLGVDAAHYSISDYSQVKKNVYPSTQAIGSAAHFLEFDGLIVPSARGEGSNLLLFMDRLPGDCLPKAGVGSVLPWEELR